MPGVFVSVDAVQFVAPGEPVEIWDRLQEEEVDPVPFMVSEFNGVPPVYVRDGRRYRKAFDNPVKLGRQVLTFCSSYYRFEPVSAVLQAKRVGQSDTLDSAEFKLFICDVDNRQRFPSFLEEPLPSLEYECEQGLPEEWERVLERSLR